MSEPILMLMLGVGLVVTAVIAKKIIIKSDPPQIMLRRPAVDQKAVRNTSRIRTLYAYVDSPLELSMNRKDQIIFPRSQLN